MELKYTKALLPGMFFEYDCVIIPGFGGFVCNERPAWYDEENEEMVPPSRDVLFNPNLTHNDGLLAQEIIRTTGVTYSKAMALAEEEASFIASKLKAGNTVEIPGVGRLYSGEDGVNRFTPSSELVRTLSSFGHSRIPLAKLAADPVVETGPTTPAPSNTETPVIPFRRKLVRAAAMLSFPLAIGAILGGTYLATDNNNSGIMLSFFPEPEAIISTFSPSEGTELDDLIVGEEGEVNDLNIVYVDPAPESTNEPEPTPEPTPTPPPAPQINFLIVGGAFSIEENAQTLANELKKEGYEPSFHYQSHNNLHLVVLGEFEEEERARKAMAKARKNGRTASWLKRL